jgi:hypothetical protein
MGGNEMIRLAIDLKSSAEILGTEPEAFLELVEREQIGGVIRLDDQWRISVFTLARLLNTTPEALLEFVEDYVLGQMIEEVEDDEWFEGQEGWQVYQGYLAEANE